MKLEEVEELNTMRHLQEKLPLKLCQHCKHHIIKHGDGKCQRNLERDYSQVSGKMVLVGEEKFCEIEREITGTHKNLVKNGMLCGAIGQYWELSDSPYEEEKGRFYWLTRWFKR